MQNALDDDFEEAVNLLIANSRSAPMLEDLSKGVEEAKIRRQNHGIRDGYATPGGFIDPLVNAARGNKTADPEFVAACLKLIRDKLGGKMNKEQFFQGCDYLDTVAKELVRK